MSSARFATITRTSRTTTLAAFPDAMSPQNRLIRPEEVTAAALWLCGPGSDAVNGQAIPIIMTVTVNFSLR